MRSGAAYIEALRDGRAVLLDGVRVGDVTAHSAFAEPIRRVAEGYDRARAALDVTTCLDPETGQRIGAMWLKPRTAADLEVRRAVHRFWAEGSYGLMGRTPDHVACVLTAFASARDFFAQGGAGFGDNAVRFYERARRDDLYVTYAIVPPQVDRTRPAHQHPQPFLHPGVVKERDGGIVLRGCQAIATSAVLSDWLFLSYITPLAPGDDDYAISVVMPIGAEGLRLYPRRPFSAVATSTYDYPLSTRFDEGDTVVVLRDVFVPWEQVFIYRNVDLVNRQFHDTPSHTLANFQSLVRFGVKLQFMAGLALKLAEVQGGAGSAAVQAQLGGDIAALCASFDALVHAAAS
jgi:4-hydroxyphenylacetate 3-monooxygenase